MAEVSWTNEAQRWLNDIFEYIAADNPQAAARTVEGIYERAQDLRRFPKLGRRRRIVRVASSNDALRTSAHPTRAMLTSPQGVWPEDPGRSAPAAVGS